MKYLWLGMTCAAVLVGVSFLPPVSQAQDAPMFVQGQRLIVVWDCQPLWVAQLVSQTVANGQPLDPCFSETLDVVVAWKNGWLTVTDEQGERWNVNPARAIGYKAQAAGRQAGR